MQFSPCGLVMILLRLVVVRAKGAYAGRNLAGTHRDDFLAGDMLPWCNRGWETGPLRVCFARKHPGFSAAVLCAGLCIFGTASHADGTIQFNRDVLPILSSKCYTCHGPDSNKRKAEIRFDLKDALFGKTKGGLDIVVPGKPSESELFKRITHPDADERMPPAASKLELTEQNIQTLKTWIEEGAEWQGHWAFIPPQKPVVPQVSNESWCRNEMDHFILERLDKAGLVPSAEADKEALIRRVSLDLTGLPPTPGEVDAFVADTSDNAYEKVVDRLLASPHYGERMAFIWLDEARYADTHGYQRDTKRTMWPWRDWVIDAFNSNMPYDEFAVEQLAGDLLPDATRSQCIATGFNRNHRINSEDGIIPEEYAVEYVVDRVSTTSTVFMGITMGCARCHDHKFDPLTQKEFYELYSIFGQVPEEGKGLGQGNDRPFIEVPTPEQSAHRAELTDRLKALQAQLAAKDDRLDTLQADWEKELGQSYTKLDWQPVNASGASSSKGAVLDMQGDNSIVASGPVPDQDVYTVTFTAPRAIGAIKLEMLVDSSLPDSGPGRGADGSVVLTGFEVERARANTPDNTEPIRVTDACADYARQDANGAYSIRNAIDADPATGWDTGAAERREKRTAVFVLDGAAAIAPGDRVTVKLHQESAQAKQSMGRFRLSESPSRAMAGWTKPTLDPWHYVGPFKVEGPTNLYLDVALPPEEGYDEKRTYGDGALHWVEMTNWPDGKVATFDTMEPSVHYLHRSVHVEVPTPLTLSLGSNDGIKVWLDGEEQLANTIERAVGPDQEKLTVFLESGTHDILIKIANYGGDSGFYFRLVDDEGQGLLAMMELLATPLAQRNPESQKRLAALCRARDPLWRASELEAKDAQRDLDALNKSIVTTMVMEDLKEPRDTYRAIRGVYDKPDTSEKLFPSTPAALGEMDESLPRNRLGFARWLVNPKHPLTARVRVNQFFQMYFGRGIVKTSEDFGTQGSAPTHPELLDWLAVHFMESGWDIKAMQKLIVTSATYRQRSITTKEQEEKDPANLLLSHMPRVRLAAEIIRDQALLASGLLSPQVGGPSVKPYQPDDLWSALTAQNRDEFDTNFYVQDTGDNLYRRGLYTYWKRTIPPPHMQIFNAAGRETCSMRQENTNTPMQALAIMNDPTFVEAARFLGQRMIREGGERPDDRIRYGFRLLLAHDPNPRKEQVLLSALDAYQAHYAQHQDEAEKILNVGDSKPDAAIAEAELAAYTMLASVMLNMDEAITRE